MEFNLTLSFVNAFKLSLKLIVVITSLLICYEFFENSKIYGKLEKAFEKPLSKIGFSSGASITMVVGIVLGIEYGAGILIKNATSSKMSYKEVLLSSLFLATCHAVFEDTLIFVAIGGNGFIMLGVRMLLAVVIISIIAKFLNFDKMKYNR